MESKEYKSTGALMLNWIRYHLLSLSVPIQKLMQKIGKPEPLVHFTEVANALNLMEPGDCILTRENWRLTNIFIPGYWSHAAIYVGGGEIVEAVAPSVRLVNAIEMLLKKDEFVVLRPSWMDKLARSQSSLEARSYIGISYDYLFETNKALYCSELVYQAYKYAGKTKPPLKLMKTFGVYNINPDHFAVSKDMKFVCIGGKGKKSQWRPT